MKLQWALIVGLFSSLALAGAAPPLAFVQAEVGDDGSVVIEGVRYTDGAPFKAELDRLKKRHANIVLHIKPNGDHPVNFEAIGKVISLFQKAGVPKVGFVVGPRTR